MHFLYLRLWDVRQGETGPDRWRDKTVPFAVQSCPKLLPKNLRKILSVGLAMPIDNVRIISVRQGNQLQQENDDANYNRTTQRSRCPSGHHR